MSPQLHQISNSKVFSVYYLIIVLYSFHQIIETLMLFQLVLKSMIQYMIVFGLVTHEAFVVYFQVLHPLLTILYSFQFHGMNILEDHQSGFLIQYYPSRVPSLQVSNEVVLFKFS